MSWNSNNTYIFLFNVNRGLSIFIRLPNNKAIIYDVGRSTEFKPLSFIKNHIFYKLKHPQPIKQIVLSHPHLDHIAELKYLRKEWNLFNPSLLTCPHDKSKDEKVNWKRVNNPNKEETKRILKIYKRLYDKRSPPLQCPAPEKNDQYDVEVGLFYIRPPICEKLFPPQKDQEYTNSLSLVFWYRHGKNTILLPGDITPEAMKYLLEENKGTEKRFSILNFEKMKKLKDWHRKTLQQPSLKELLKKHGLTILVAPHHGLESGFSEDLYNAIEDKKPRLVLISDKRHTGKNDGKIDSRYQNAGGAKSIKVNLEVFNPSGEKEIKEENRVSLSTRNNHHILLVFKENTSPDIYARKDPKDLVRIVESKHEKH